jgi:hypothetical protein
LKVVMRMRGLVGLTAVVATAAGAFLWLGHRPAAGTPAVPATEVARAETTPSSPDAAPSGEMARARPQAPAHRLSSPEPTPAPGRATEPDAVSELPRVTPAATQPVEPPAGVPALPAPVVASSPVPLPAAASADTLPAPPSPTPPESDPKGVEKTVKIKKDAVIGIRLEQTVTSETASPDDKISAHVARDVLVDGRVVIPAGTAVEGVVTLVERGLQPPRIGVRFVALILGDDERVPIQTETIFRGAESGGDPSASVGASAALGALLSNRARAGGLGRIGGAPVLPPPARGAARIQSGSPLTIKLTATVSIEVSRLESR